MTVPRTGGYSLHGCLSGTHECISKNGLWEPPGCTDNAAQSKLFGAYQL
jgi:hypothetical protein